MEVNPIQALLQEMARRRFYGSLEIKLEAGKVVLLRKTETVKLVADDCRDNRGTYHERVH
jgi:hypothetical protein